MQTISGVYFFAKLSRQRNRNIAKLAVRHTKPLGSYLFKQGDPVTNFFITLKGDFRVSKKITHKIPVNDNHIKDIIKDPLAHQKKSVFEDHGHLKKNTQIIELEILGYCQPLGIEDIFHENPTYSYSVNVASHLSTYLVISLSEIQKFCAIPEVAQEISTFITQREHKWQKVSRSSFKSVQLMISSIKKLSLSEVKN